MYVRRENFDCHWHKILYCAHSVTAEYKSPVLYLLTSVMESPIVGTFVMCFSRTIFVAETKLRVDDDDVINNDCDEALDAEIETRAFFLALFAAIIRTMRAAGPAAPPLFGTSILFCYVQYRSL